MAMEQLLELHGIYKSFHKKTILNQLSLIIHTHECIALIGHNGCGKSTLLKIIAGVSSIEQGTIQCQKKLCIEYIPERLPQLSISAKEYLMHMARIEGIHDKEATNRIHSYSKQFFMEDLLHTPMRYLSKGSLQKVGVIQALLKTCDILLMDEPLNGQDAESQNAFLSIMKQVKQHGTAIILACHEPYLIDQLADHTYRMEHGSIYEISSKQTKKQIKHLIFEPSMIPLDTTIMEKLLSYTCAPSGIHICTTASSSNDILLQLVLKGWELKEMYNEIIMES